MVSILDESNFDGVRAMNMKVLYCYEREAEYGGQVAVLGL
jgi:hypothetical protein